LRDAILQRDQRVIQFDGLIHRGEVITWDHVRLYESNTVANLPRQQDAL
jgi:predicted homoserine dehydrogenase-like protein